MADTDNRKTLLQQMAQHIETISEPLTQSDIAASTAILAGLVLDQALVQRIMRQDIMKESVIYQSNWQKAYKKDSPKG